jgi:Spy/CpxP family protein refolding chaperone
MNNLSKKLVTLCAAVGVAALLAVPAMAQEATTAPPHATMMLQHLTTKLSLTEDQQASVKELFTELQTKTQPFHTASKTLHQQLKTAFSAATPDAATVGNLVIQEHQNRAAMKAAMSEFQTKLQALLTPEQLTAYKAMQAKRASSFHRHFVGSPAATQ